MKRLSLIVLWLVVGALAGTAWALPPTTLKYNYFIYKQWGGTWQDANKNYVDDSLMCWAATASNVLDWGVWDTPTITTAPQIFQHFKDHWTNNTGVMSWGWKWWLNGSPPPYYFASYPDVPGGGNFYPEANYTDYYRYAGSGDLMGVMDEWMHQGYGVGLTIGKGTGMHAITAWGFGYTLVNGGKKYTSIYVTDSDDGVTGLRNYPLTWNGEYWYLGGGYSGWSLASLSGFKFRLSPALAGATLGGEELPAGEIIPTPLAPSWLLLGAGLLLLLLLNRRVTVK